MGLPTVAKLYHDRVKHTTYANLHELEDFEFKARSFKAYTK